MYNRSDRSAVAEWWWTIDRWFLASFIALIGFGVVLSFAASPAVAERIGLNAYHFVERHALFLIPAFVVMIGVSFLDPRQIRRLALVVLLVSVALMVMALFFGVEVKGSRRWVSMFGMSLQPSEFMKPAFVILCAWLFAESKRRPEIPGSLIAMILFGAMAALLIAQPDLGQTVLLAGTWGAMFFIAGLSWLWILVLGGVAATGMVGAYFVFPHVAGRINRFLTGEGDTFQVDTGREAIIRGGWFGQGPGEGTVKRILPDSHTDFVFSVLAEEFGIVLCGVLVTIFAFIVIRALMQAMRDHDPFQRFAVSGLAILIGFQSTINIAVNLQLMPAKGMTLPFVSYGGSSMIAVALTAGMLLALTRRRPETRAGRIQFHATSHFQPAA
ncbi:putative lipid II flippase FtsW [Oricola sp.]|uniref:putative lipid II flippase FtsW n=1 Tax=Oricola sp. TaxID=1979950 RepID=UPI000C8BD0BD|nr:putative lipid II flippase FtsW [Ahrensia sp.]MCK5750772.1 putative lipid II flippase FtsW [Oricola sp.]|tara:strand:- start:17309 stop:18463 length:1155 start_codon:yes stop_codon:yes gene_type:complete